MKMNYLHRAGALILALALLLSFPLCVSAEENSSIAVTIDKTTLTVELEERATLVATVKKDGTELPSAIVSWSNEGVDADGKRVVRTNSRGEVVGNSVGTATVTATYTAEDSKTYTATCTVTVTEPVVAVESVNIKNGSEDATEIVFSAVGDTATLTAAVLPADATNKAVSWSSSNTAVATVSSDGIVTAVAPGKATITVTAADGGKTDSVEIEVSGIVMPSKLDILVGHDSTLTPQFYGDAQGVVKMAEWASSNISIAEVSATGKITTYNLGTATITLKAGGYKVSCTVTVKADVADAVQVSMNAAEVYSFSGLLSQINSKIYAKTGKNLNYVSSLTVPTSQGVLYYGYVSPDVTGLGVGNENYYYTQSGSRRVLADVTFVPRPGFSGTAEITYAARDAGGGTVNGSVLIAVSGVSDVAYNTASGTPVTFAAEDFSHIWRAQTGHEITYITFTQPAASQGVLYYNYNEMALFNSEVNSGTKYYRTNNPYLEKITFVPAEDYTGIVTIPYSCVTAGGTYSGRVTITVYAAPGSNTGKIRYTVASGSYVELDSNDLNKACVELNGASLKYVYFTQPDVSEGTLYYNYEGINDYGSVVSETTRYFYSYPSTPRIDNVAFVPAKGFNGTVKVPVMGYDSRGESFTAEMVFKVSGSTGSVHYSTSAGMPVEFDGLDFNEACEKAAGGSLDWVSFELPRTSAGVLYRYYYSYSGIHYGSKLSASAQLTRTQLSEVVFLPDDDFFGSVTIPFNGCDTNGARFSGVVEIFVEASAGEETVEYSLVSGGVIEFDANDFNAASRALTGENLSHVSFTLPSSKYGKLYYQYDERKGTGGTVNAATNYYRGKSRLLSDVSFAAADSYSGSFTMTYTGWSTGGKRFTGKVEFTVSEPVASVIHYSGGALPVALEAEDFRQACMTTMGRELNYICFTGLPAESQGRLYYNYISPAEPGTAAVAQTKYYIAGAPAVEDLTFLAKAEYQGQVTFDYVGYDSLGKSYTGTVNITVSTSGTTTQFLDMKGYGWAAPSIDYLSKSGVVTGYSATRYGPEQAMSRGNFTLMLYRALQLEGDGSAVSYSDVPPTKYYAEAITVATQLGIVEGTDGKFYPDLPITRQSALNMTYLALQIKGREMPLVSTSVLNDYADSDQVASYAREAMASMVAMGIVKGSGGGNLNPTDAISRAEMAVLLHRVLTM